MRQLEVYVNDVKAGLLTELNPGKGYTFVYTEAYAASDMPPVSLTLPKRKEAYEAVCFRFSRTYYPKEPTGR